MNLISTHLILHTYLFLHFSSHFRMYVCFLQQMRHVINFLPLGLLIPQFIDPAVKETSHLLINLPPNLHNEAEMHKETETEINTYLNK